MKLLKRYCSVSILILVVFFNCKVANAQTELESIFDKKSSLYELYGGIDIAKLVVAAPTVNAQLVLFNGSVLIGADAGVLPFSVRMTGFPFEFDRDHKFGTTYGTNLGIRFAEFQNLDMTSAYFILNFDSWNCRSSNQQYAEHFRLYDHFSSWPNSVEYQLESNSNFEYNYRQNRFGFGFAMTYAGKNRSFFTLSWLGGFTYEQLYMDYQRSYGIQWLNVSEPPSDFSSYTTVFAEVNFIYSFKIL